MVPLVDAGTVTDAKTEMPAGETRLPADGVEVLADGAS